MIHRFVAGENRFELRMIFSVMAAMLVTGVMAVPARAGAPAEKIQNAIEKVVAILNDPKLKAEARKKERLEQLRREIYPKFDLAEMAKRSLGSHWQKRSAEEQSQFVKLFTEIIENAYMENLAAYNGEKVTIAGEKQDREFAEVQSKIATKDGKEYAVDYKLHQVNGDWKIYDVVVENVSLVNNYRSQFNRVIAQSSFEELVRRMKNKAV